MGSSASAQQAFSAIPSFLRGSAFVFEGDSITEGIDVTTPERFSSLMENSPQFSAVAEWANVATSGNQLSTITTQYPTEVYPYRPSANGGRPAILSVEIGANDFWYLPDTAAVNVYFGQLVDYWEQAQADGFTVIAWTIAHRQDITSPSIEARRAELNKLIRNSEIPEFIFDFSVLLPMAPDPAYFAGDNNVHPSAVGHYWIAEALGEQILEANKTMPGLNSQAFWLENTAKVYGDKTFTGSLTVPLMLGNVQFNGNVGMGGATPSGDPLSFGGSLFNTGDMLAVIDFFGARYGFDGGLFNSVGTMNVNTAGNIMARFTEAGVVINRSLLLSVANVAGDQTLTFGSNYNQFYTGAGGNTWTLPAIANNTGLVFNVKNIGSGAVNVSGPSVNTVFDAAATTSVALAVGDGGTFTNNGTYWAFQRTA